MNLRTAKTFFIIFYLAGLIGIMITATRGLFIRLVPLALILGLTALVIFHESKINLKIVLVSVIIFLLGLFIEIIGVNTGLVFGKYTYGNSLGFKILNTPVCIGINWLMLTYISSSIVNRFKIPVSINVIGASLIMVFYDFVLEWVAPAMNMWVWHDNHIPLQNYVAWFIIALFFQTIFQIFRIHTGNKITFFLFGIEIGFFFTLALYFNLLH